MIAQVSGLVRDAWWYLPMIIVGALLLGFLMKPVVGIVTIFASIGILIYFALMRYDERGNEKTHDI